MWEGFDWPLVSAICYDRAWSMQCCRKYLCYWPVRVTNVRCKVKCFHFAYKSQASLLNVFLNFLICRSTFRRIVRNKSTEHFSGLPYIYALLNCLICMWYGSPIISDDNLLVMTVNSAGAVFQFVYIMLFIAYADKANKVSPSFLIQRHVFLSARTRVFYCYWWLVLRNFWYCCQVRMTGFLLAIIGAFAVVVAGSLQIPELALRRITVGLLSGASLISMFASPLFIIVSSFSDCL